MSGFIPKENLGNFQRWQIGSFDGSKSVATNARQDTPVAVESVPSEAVEMPTAERIEQIFEEARQSGYDAGYQAGLEEGRVAAEQAAAQALEAQAGEFAALIGGLKSALDDVDQHVAEQLLELATGIAAQMVRGTLAIREDVLMPVVREAIAALPVHHAHVTLRLNPADADRVRGHLGEQLTQAGTQIVEDAEITPGGCIVRAGASEVDASIETRWKRVIESIGSTATEWIKA